MTGMLATTRPNVPSPRFTLGRDVFDDLERFAARALGDRFGELIDSGSIPPIDVSETDDSVDVTMDLPGVDPKQIDVRVNGATLTVSARREEEKEEEGKTFHRVERRVGSCSRTVTLPSTVDDAKVEARYHDGVLSVKLPKSEKTKARKIAVQS
ncbi:Hsp20/alpha crystallin family protein [Botrimarina sp.]|uniref:Hsp20/alpha crystallin family protein n=1 Tax=Botrimarina sp. TaxID=2795802 RepID=UPI0032F07147